MRRSERLPSRMVLRLQRRTSISSSRICARRYPARRAEEADMKSDIRILPVLAAVALIAGCDGGSSGAGRGRNAAPSLSNIASQTINQDTPTAALAFTVNDDGGADAVTLSAVTSDAAVVPA